jgi:hypothetical protein
MMGMKRMMGLGGLVERLINLLMDTYRIWDMRECAFIG